MASDIKISQMTSASSLTGDELIPIVQSGVNKNTTVSKLKEGLATLDNLSTSLSTKVNKDGDKVLSDKNFTEDYENKLKGIEDNANNYVLPAAGELLGGVKQGVAVEDATSADDIITKFNLLLTSLRDSGIIANSITVASAMSYSRASSNVVDYTPPMALTKGTIYKENEILYKCTQNSNLAISNKLSDLVGYYVEKV